MSEWTSETAEWYAEKYGEYPTNRLAIDALTLASDAVVVDVGCGAGAALRHAAARVDSGRLIGIDPVPRMLEIARERSVGHPHGGRIEFLLGPASALPLDDGVADVVLAFDSFDHWGDREAGLREVQRVLGRGGRFVVVKDGGLPGGAGARRRFVDRLARAGFEVVRTREIEEGEIGFVMWECRLT
jgi:SAM-dependent methyltransferase